jgi:hypothetical protein
MAHVFQWHSGPDLDHLSPRVLPGPFCRCTLVHKLNSCVRKQIDADLLLGRELEGTAVQQEAAHENEPDLDLEDFVVPSHAAGMHNSGEQHGVGFEPHLQRGITAPAKPKRRSTQPPGTLGQFHQTFDAVARRMAGPGLCRARW